MEILTLFLIGLSLSIDAFSMSLAYGLIGIKKDKIVLSSLIVGLFHFFMPLLGSLIGYKLLNYLKINPKYLIIIIILILLVEMVKSIKDEEVKSINMNILGMLGFALLVSIDSFTVGMGIYYITDKPIYASIVFSIVSFCFTLLGYTLGKYVSKKIEKISKYIGIIILLILLVYFLF